MKRPPYIKTEERRAVVCPYCAGEFGRARVTTTGVTECPDCGEPFYCEVHNDTNTRSTFFPERAA
ncbi:MAG: hypothetical protein ACO1Q7_02000 [Gemmatimonas sp.]